MLDLIKWTEEGPGAGLWCVHISSGSWLQHGRQLDWCGLMWTDAVMCCWRCWCWLISISFSEGVGVGGHWHTPRRTFSNWITITDSFRTWGVGCGGPIWESAQAEHSSWSWSWSSPSRSADLDPDVCGGSGWRWTLESGFLQNIVPVPDHNTATYSSQTQNHNKDQQTAESWSKPCTDLWTFSTSLPFPLNGEPDPDPDPQHDV